MSEPNTLPQDIWESTQLTEFVIQESASEVDGKYILAKVRGPAFFPNTTSRNNVFYSLEAWENAISDPLFRTRLADRLVYGTIGHAAELDDDGIREGKHSHIVTNVWIDESGIGQAEYLVLNTGPGQVLNTSLRIRSKLRVSTRAAGFFDDKVTKGVKSVIPSSFKLERIDFVIDPGYTDALPNLIESLHIDSTEQLQPPPTKGIEMTEKVVELLESRVLELKQEKQITESTAASLQTEIRSIAESAAKTQAMLESYQSLGTKEGIQEAFGTLSQYVAIGSVHEIHEALEQSEETITNLSDTIDDIKAELDEEPVVGDEEGAEYKELGSPSDVKDALTQALELTGELQQYRDLGTVEELQQVVDSATAMTEEAEEAATAALVDSLGVSRDVVDNLLAKGLTTEEVTNLISQIKGVSEATPEVEEVPAADAAPITDEPVTDEPLPEVDLEDEDEKPMVGESMSSQLLRRTRRKQPSKILESKGQPAKLSLAARLLTGKKQ